MKKIIGYLAAAIMLAAVLLPSLSHALTVGGAVRQPLNLDTESLARLATSEARLTDFTRDRKYSGVFVYRGVPLRTVLEMAKIEKDGPGFNKTTDLAIAVRTRDGKTAVLSWGEVFYRNPENVLIAVSASPVRPHMTSKCGECHAPSFYQPALDKLNRRVGFPKMVLANDFYADRSLEDVVAIEVVALKGDAAKKDAAKPSPARFTLIDGTGRSSLFSSLSGHPLTKIDFKEVGDGRGFHGSRTYEGVPLRELLRKAGGSEDIDKVVLVTSTDGYRATFSSGEIFLNPLGERIIISESSGKSSDGDRKFTLVIPDDLAADRMVKTVSRIEVLSLKQQPKLYVVSMGCADPALLTLEAVSAMGKADGSVKRFSLFSWQRLFPG